MQKIKLESLFKEIISNEEFNGVNGVIVSLNFLFYKN